MIKFRAFQECNKKSQHHQCTSPYKNTILGTGMKTINNQTEVCHHGVYILIHKLIMLVTLN